MGKLDDNQIIAMLAEMRDSPPPILAIKSPQKNLSDSEDEIPSSQPASTRPNATVGFKQASPTDDIQPSQPVPKLPKTEPGFSNLRNKISYIETRRAKTRSPFLFLEYTPAKEPAQLVCNIGPSYTSDQTKTSKPVFNRSVPELNKTSSDL